VTDPTVTALGIETSGAEGSVAVVRDGSSLGETVLSPGLVHGRQVIPALRDLLERLRLPLADVSIIAVNRGPGSHTGLRVGVTAAKVLGFAIGRPVRGIEAVDALVDQVRRQSGAAVSEPVAVAIDARSDRVFGGIWDNGDWRSPPALGPAAEHFGLHALALPMRSVGVKADLRAYEHPVMLSGNATWETLIEATSAITADVPGINRCVWNLGPQPPIAASAVAAGVTRERLDLLREADALVMLALERHGIYDQVWQCPTVLVPCALRFADAHLDGEMIVVRPVASRRAMTARPVALPTGLLDDLRRDILALDGVTSLALDITSKPPGTIEWE